MAKLEKSVYEALLRGVEDLEDNSFVGVSLQNGSAIVFGGNGMPMMECHAPEVQDREKLAHVVRLG